MSLVGSLEDLGLGDILQIVSLSRKSGLLLLRSDHGDGRIVFCEGLVRAAYVKGEVEELEELLLRGGFAEQAAVAQAREQARLAARPLEDVLREQLGLSPERLESLRREQVERSVLRMFTWRAGEFSFEVRDELEPRDASLALSVGVNAQYLTMEATRLGDEAFDPAPAEADEPADAEAVESDEEFVFSGEAETAEPTPRPDADPPAPADPQEVVALATAARQAEEPEAGIGSPAAGAEAEADGLDADLAEAATPEPARAAPDAEGSDAPPSVPLIAIDPELRGLEWLKATLNGLFQRVHIFQRPEAGLERIRQYLSRGQHPAVLLSHRTPSDPGIGAVDSASLLRRLRAQAPRMPLLVIHDGSSGAPPQVDGADALVKRPPLAALADRRRRDEVQEAAEALRSALAPWARPSAAPPREPAATRTPDAEARLQRLGQLSTRLRDPSTRGDVLNLVLDFVAESFGRVAMFMVRDEVAVGIAQRRLCRAGGPQDADFEGVSLPVAESGWLRGVVESRESLRAPPSDAGDHRLAALLGDRPPPEAFLAPIESGGRVAAVLYADNLPDCRPMGDTTVVAIVLHEAGLALDRALLERALERAERGQDPAA